jgi:GTP-binding protein
VKASIALVGRPNVGKSRLFNRLTGRRISIVHDQPGTTRDVVIEELPNGVTLMDTGGIGLGESQENADVRGAVEEQVDFAIGATEVIFFIVDARAGCTPFDYEIAEKLRTSGKKIYLIANKIDSEKEIDRGDIFHNLGLGEVTLASAEHGYGEEVLRKIIDHYASQEPPKGEQPSIPTIKICLLGRPNVGKSSISNVLLKKNRSIIHENAGTTRDAIRCDFTFEEGERKYLFRLIDTAGLREKRKIDSSVEFFSTLRSIDAMGETDIVLLIVDALSGIRRQDKKLMDRILREGKCLMLLVNKWDLALKAVGENQLSAYRSIEEFQKKFRGAVEGELFALSQFPIIFLSAQTGYGIRDVLNTAICLFERASQNISTGKLNRVIQDLMDRHPPAASSGRSFKIYYAVHSGTFPFRMKIFCNRRQRLSEPYERYLEKGIREAFDLFGCPLKFEFVDKEVRYGEKTA